ncbi:hypothetical protein A3F03_03470 [Candidatus Roizmanbacteria bacterium RIFCSPHIGHO2_12_FULL_41_11]|uniref:AAA family ATPase n=1 Tax=Candidatus Roizmanbacteria bacterium RIFCSPHIGHO2_12_FULL_41_11 TaxID=1802052 RepID=A0A1F7I338_9BACT|nr:MAG: hypothetical protein A3F03_03470 [Candidatus Roizmanbacteria bacterium RIFCSPHIGHO2_12_FULL_41_11]
MKYGKIPEVEKKVKELQLQWKKIPQEERLLKEEVTEDDIAQIVARWTGIPVARLLSTESERLIHLENELKAQVVGQDYALHKIANAVLRSRAGLSEENRPIGSFLLLGPTGVGKTETAKALAYTLFNDKKAMIRFDMSEYQEAHTVARLIGAPPGYIGFDEGGQLTEAVRRKPYSVVLFDEVEKAHSQIFNIFLQILDEGRLTDSRGRVVNFKNTVIILTSNLGSDVFQQSLKEQELAKEVMSRVKKFFKPEFINRLDSIVIFNALDELMITKIVDLQLQEVILRLKKQYLDFEVTELLKRHLRQVGFDPIYGARPLKRIINELIIDEIALEVIENNIKPGDKIIANFKKGKVQISIKKPS